MATKLIYSHGVDSVTLEALKTRNFKREHKYEGQDYLYTKYTIEVTAMLAKSVNSYNAALAANANLPPSSTDPNIREHLMAKRGILEFEVDGVEICRSPLSGFSADHLYGPHPLYCNVTRIDGAGAFIIDYGIETCIDENAIVGSQALRSHRWEMMDEIDGDYMTVRHINGKAVFGGDFLFSADVADLRRNRFWPPVLDWMKRERVQVRLSEDGREIRYQITDVERVLPMGPTCPATHLEAYYSPQVNLASGADAKGTVFGAQILVRARGPRNVSRQELLTQAIQVAFVKLIGSVPAANGQNGPRGDFFIYQAGINYSLHANMVELTCAARLAQPGTFWQGLPFASAPDKWRLGFVNDLGDMTRAFASNGAPEKSRPMERDAALSGGGCRGTLTNKLVAQIIRNDRSVVILPMQIVP